MNFLLFFPCMLEILFWDGKVSLSAKECFVVLRGIEHKPFAHDKVHCLLIEKAGTLNTGHQHRK